MLSGKGKTCDPINRKINHAPVIFSADVDKQSPAVSECPAEAYHCHDDRPGLTAGWHCLALHPIFIWGCGVGAALQADMMDRQRPALSMQREAPGPTDTSVTRRGSAFDTAPSPAQAGSRTSQEIIFTGHLELWMTNCRYWSICALHRAQLIQPEENNALWRLFLYLLTKAQRCSTE